SGATGTPAYAVYSASKASLFRIADSVVHFGHDQGLRIFEMAPGVVETAMTKSMPVHDFRTEGDWTTPEQVTGLALALASGSLDAFTGRYVRAGADTEESLRAEAAAGLSDSTRRLVLG
ncbi:SDR family oxidoreductase, partial [Geobacillus sp. MMMUD3]|nr:SDR family oxidoreductase [Geobacillus sp. MMMUD3]